jgi:hypothetical protein
MVVLEGFEVSSAGVERNRHQFQLCCSFVFDFEGSGVPLETLVSNDVDFDVLVLPVSADASLCYLPCEER